MDARAGSEQLAAALSGARPFDETTMLDDDDAAEPVSSLDQELATRASDQALALSH